MKTKTLSVILLSLSFWISSLAFADLPQSISGRDVVTGKEVKRSLDKDTTVLVFVSAKCPCSASHEDTLKTLAKNFGSEKVQFIGIHSNADEDRKKTEDHFKGSKLPFPVIEDEGQKFADAFGALKTPHVFIVASQFSGGLVYAGGVDDSHTASKAKKHFLQDALEALRAGRKPEVAEGKTMGCAIKRKG